MSIPYWKVRARAFDSAALAYPSGVAVDSSGNLYIADQGNHRIRKVGTSGCISTVAGNGAEGFSGDGGLATSAMFDWPMSVAVASGSGNLYIADQVNNRIRKVTKSTGIVTTFAGNGSTGFLGDGGPALSVELHWPCEVTIYGSDLYVADQVNNRIRKLLQ